MANASNASTDWAAWIGAVTGVISLLYLIGAPIWASYHKPAPKIRVEYLSLDDPPEHWVGDQFVTRIKYGPGGQHLLVILTNTGNASVVIHDVRLRFPDIEAGKHGWFSIPVFGFSQESGDSPTLNPGEGHYYACLITSDLLNVVFKNGFSIPDTAVMQLQVRSATETLWTEQGPRSTLPPPGSSGIIYKMVFDLGLVDAELRHRSEQRAADNTLPAATAAK